MSLFRNAVVGAAANFILVAGTAGTIALEAGPYSRANVSQAAPFGAILVNVGDLRPSAPMNLIRSLSPGQLIELNQRCAVVIAGPFHYGRPNVGFCTRMLSEQGLLVAAVEEENVSLPPESSSDSCTEESSSSSSS
ncbi:MAG: hypothetical protein AB7O56_15955 [Bauldia sp.]